MGQNELESGNVTYSTCRTVILPLALPQYLKLTECLLHVSSMNCKEGKHVVGVLKVCVCQKAVFGSVHMGLDSTKCLIYRSDTHSENNIDRNSFKDALRLLWALLFLCLIPECSASQRTFVRLWWVDLTPSAMHSSEVGNYSYFKVKCGSVVS